MRRFTVNYRFGQDYLPIANYHDMKSVGKFLYEDNEEGIGFRVFDNEKKDWVEPESVFLACVLSGGRSQDTDKIFIAG
jgi:hypothetical protein